MRRFIIAAVCCAAIHAPLRGQESFVNWESPQVHPLELTPDGGRLLAVNTADNRLEVFDVRGDKPILVRSIPVGLDPVSVRARNNDEAWVVNHISDSVSIVDLTTLRVIKTVATDDEPCDAVFAGSPERAFVTCSQVNTVMVFDPEDTEAEPLRIAVDGQDPRAMAVSPDGTTVYVAVFESGNRSTILGGGAVSNIGFPPNVVNDPEGPYGGVNPPPNDGTAFNPPQNPSNPDPPAVGLIVKQDAQNRWMDDNNGDWTELVSGSLAEKSGRLEGWVLMDHDVALIDADTLSVTYAGGLMNMCMALAVNPASGSVSVVGTDGTNEIRYEPNLSGRFLRVNLGLVDPANPSAPTVVDLNPHLDYVASNVPQEERDLSIGDPRGVAWNADGTRGYVTGMGSNNVIVIGADGKRIDGQAPIDVGEGPTGVVVHEAKSRLYVLNKFEDSLSAIDTDSLSEVSRMTFYDPSPSAIKVGRKHLYGTHTTSGLGHIACASCHVDSRMDRLAWDLGNPAGAMKEFNQNCGAGVIPGCEDWHPMKGPMSTQTLQDIIAHEPFHWRGDRDGLEEFNGAFMSLQGDDDALSDGEMQEYEDFLATIHFPPNPFRNRNNSLPTDLPLPGHYTTGRFEPAGQPLPNGDADNGLDLYRTADLDQGLECVSCHSLPTGAGTNYSLDGLQFKPLPVGPNGELHLMVVSIDGLTNVSLKVPQLRNLYEKVGSDLTQLSSTAGFGFLHDGSVDSIARFVSEPVFSVASDQEVADLVAFMLSFSGSDLPSGTPSNPFELPGPPGKDAHAAVGFQVTLDDTNKNDPVITALLTELRGYANADKIGLVVKGIQSDVQRGYEYIGGNTFQSDRMTETVGFNVLRLSASNDAPLTYTTVPFGSEARIGVDRDEDGFLDRDELDACSDPADPASVPGPAGLPGDIDMDGDVDVIDFAAFTTCAAGPASATSELCGCRFDFDLDGDVDLTDFGLFQTLFTGG